MDSYRQRTIAELLKKTSKLIKPRITTILEGKDRMKGPLDITDPNIDFASLKVCKNCRNHLDASIAQYCGICKKGHHSFCLEAPLNEAADRSVQCCYDCQHKADLDSNQPVSSLKDSHSELSEDRMDICQSNENAPECEEPGTSYDASDRSPVSRKMDLSWHEASPSKQPAGFGGLIFDTVYKPTKTRAARKLGIRRKRVTDNFGSDSPKLPSETDMLTPTRESSGVDATLEVGGVVPTCSEPGSEEIDHMGSPTLDIQTNTLRIRSGLEEANGNQLLEVRVGSPVKDTHHSLEETVTADNPAKEGCALETEKSIESPKLDVAVTSQLVSGSSYIPLEGCLTDVSTILEAPSVGIKEDGRVMSPQTSRDLAKEEHSLTKTYAVPQMIVEEDAGERQILIVRQVSSAEEVPKQDGDARHLSAMVCHTDLPSQITSQGTRLPTSHRALAFDFPKSKPSSSSILDGQTQDEMSKPSIFTDMKGAVPYTVEEMDEHLSNGLVYKAGNREWIPHKQLPSPKVLEDIDSNSAGSEITAPFMSSSNTRAVIEDEIKVCDLCGDSGYEDMLAICSECNGAEHVYCYENLTAQVPEGFWQCDNCKLKQKAGDYRSFTDVRTVNPLPSRLQSFNSSKKHNNVGNSRSRLSALLQKRKLPSEKKRAMKGIPSSQFPAKRGLPVVDAPPTKKQAVEASSPPYTPSAMSLKLGPTKEAYFKVPDTGKGKLVSNTALLSSTGEGTGLSSRGSGKFLLLTGSSSSNLHNSSMAQSGQMSKGRFSNASSPMLGPGNAKVTITSQPNMPSSLPIASTGMKTSAALKSSESPSFLLSSKPMGAKLQPSLKSSKESSDNLGPQGSSKEDLSGPSSKSSTRSLLNYTGSFKLSKGSSMGGSLEQKVRPDVNLDSAKLSGSRNVHSEVGLLKPAAESRYEALLNSGAPEIKSKALAATESLETHNGLDKLIKSEPGGSLQNVMDDTMPGTSRPHEAQRGSAISNPVKEVQDLNIEQDKISAFQVTSPQSLARQTSKLPEKVGADTLKEVSTISTDVTQSAPLLPRPVLVIQESSTIKEDENKLLQLADTADVDGDKNALAVVEKASPQDDSRSSFTPRSRTFGAWVSPSYVPSLGSTRCYRCKELGHSAKNCNNRSSTPCASSEAAGALKASLPDSNADSTFISKGASPVSTDKASRNAQSDLEAVLKIKPTAETAPTIKPSSSERGVIFTQNLNSLVGEAQTQVEEGQVIEDVTPSACSVVDQAMRKDTPIMKHIAESPTKVSVEGTPHTDRTRETTDGKKELDNTSICIMNSNVVNVSSGTQSTTLAAEWQPPLLSIPSLTSSASATLTPVSSTNVKATNLFVSRYQESLKVYPEAQIVWQGTFEVGGKAKPQVSFHGLQANPSNRALPKVREVAKKLQPSLPLEELPRGSEHNSWPVQFQKSPPINDNIALYFFASGKESYVQYYKPLVDRLIKFDLTLKGFFEDAELLIFPSNLLPPGSQCWNNFMFLWAVFRAKKLQIKQTNMYFTSFESKQAGSDIGSKEQPVQSSVPTWGKAEDMQIDTSANITVDIPQAAGNKIETPSLTVAGVSTGRHGPFSDSDIVVCEQSPLCQQGPQCPVQGDTVAKEEQKAQAEPFHPQLEKALATVSPSTQDSSAIKRQLLSDVFFVSEGGSNLSASKELSEKLNSNIKLEEKVDTSVELMIPSAPKVSSVLVRSEQGSIDKAKHSTPLMGTLPALLGCPSPRDRQEDVWTPRKLSSHSPAAHQDKDKGLRERVHEKSDKLESGRGVSRDRDRERQRDRERHKERDRDRDRSRRHSDWERERERERAKERERERDRERDRDRGRDRERERDRERWREREERDRRGRDWDRDRDKVGDRDKGRDRGREREAERERALTRERSRHRHWDTAEADYGRSGRHWYRHPRSRSPSRSPPGNRDLSPSRPRLDRYHRYHRSFRHSRSYSHSPDSDHVLARLQPTRAESRDLSKDSFAPKGKSPDIVAEESRAAKEESAVKNSVVKGSVGEEQGNYSQRGSNSNSLCRENSAGKERKLPIADLNLSPSEIEGNEDEGNDDEVMMSVKVAMKLTVAHQNEHVRGCQEFVPVDGHGGELGKCSVSGGKMCNNQSAEGFMCVDDSQSLSLPNDSSGPSHFPLSVSRDGSSSCLHFFSRPMEDDNKAPNLPDLSLGLGAKEQSPPQQPELPLFMQLLAPCQGSSLVDSSDVPMTAEQADLSLSLSIPEHSKRPVVNTSLRLFG